MHGCARRDGFDSPYRYQPSKRHVVKLLRTQAAIVPPHPERGAAASLTEVSRAE